MVLLSKPAHARVSGPERLVSVLNRREQPCTTINRRPVKATFIRVKVQDVQCEPVVQRHGLKATKGMSSMQAGKAGQTLPPRRGTPSLS